MASRDLKSPMRAISSLMEFVEEDSATGDFDAVRAHALRVRQRVDRAEPIVNDLLDYGKAVGRDDGLSMVEPEALIEAALDRLNVPAGFIVTTKVAAERFRANGSAIETVLRNLVDNAIKHHDQEFGVIAIDCLASDTHVGLAIRDNGPGIPEPARRRMFRLFQTFSQSNKSGSALGLAISKRLVEGRGSSIELGDNDADRGMCVTVRWPRFQAKNG